MTRVLGPLAKACGLQSIADRGVVGAMSKCRALTLLLGLVAFLLAGATVPHVHAGAQPGLWNAEHDLTLMAAFGTYATQPDAIPVLGPILAFATTITLVAAHVGSVPLSLSDSRAPPLF